MKRAAGILAGLALATCCCHAFHFRTTDSENIHSNDTLALFLSPEITDNLRGPPGSEHQITFKFINRANSDQFVFEGQSEDRLQGRVNPERRFVSQADETTVSVYQLRVPEDAVPGQQMRYTLTARRLGVMKREAQYEREDYDEQPYEPPRNEDVFINDRGNTGGSFYPNSGGGGGQFYPQQPNSGGEGGSYNPAEPYYPQPNNRQPFVDPSFRDQISQTILFTVTEPGDTDSGDNSSPWISAEYKARSRDETCTTGAADQRCLIEWWFVEFTVQDTYTGLNRIMVQTNQQDDKIPYTRDQTIYYRYPNFPLGDTQEHKVVVGASCCWERVTLTATDIAGNENTYEATKWDYGSGSWLTPTVMWILIGVGIALALIIVVVVVACCCCKKDSRPNACGGCCGCWDRVSQNDG